MTPEVFGAALATLRHRGPDGTGIHRDQDLWFGHTRLSILDLSTAGSQPMATPDGRYVITYNGEIYNFHEIAVHLGPTLLVSRSDTEVLLQAFAQQGTRLLEKLNGMFAFALHDRIGGKLFLARDRFGIKPLYYRLDHRGLAFASEIKGIVALGDRRATCDLAALHEWLYYGNALGERTLHAGIRQLLPGHCLEVDLTTFDVVTRAFHATPRPMSSNRERGRGFADPAAQVLNLFEAAVRAQLVSDVPVGVFLSGGVDSSAITAFASKHYAGRISTYSVGFDFDPRANELPIARRVADRFATSHHEISIRGADVGAVVETLVSHHDSPFADAANIPLYLMARAIHSETKVVLQGDGGDEVFGGYRRYVSLRHYRALRFLAMLLRSPLGLGRRTAAHYRLRRYLNAFTAGDLGTTLALLLTQESPEFEPQAIFGEALRESLLRTDPFARFHELQADVAGRPVVDQLSSIDMRIQLPDLYLEKVDRATMASGVEVRVPFLDNALVEYAESLPASRKMPWGRKKWLLKRALEGTLPREILRGRKRGLTVPYGAWLQTALKPMFFDHLATFARRHPGVLERAQVERMFARTRDGLQNHAFMLWKVFNFMLWVNMQAIDFSIRENR
jgi:asparagine synthase (glutamine-hydrolysing)